MKRIPVVSLRLVRERTIAYGSRRLESSKEVYDLFRLIAEDLDREGMWVACLDAKNQITCLSQVALGTLASIPLHPREILKVALLSNAASVITVHNHPSGDPEPSPEDRRATSEIKQAAGTLGIKLLDHLIVGDGAYYSFADGGGL